MNTPSKNVLVTGCSKGIGKEFVSQYAKEGYRVFATCRSPADNKDILAIDSNVSLHTLDVTNPDQLQDVATELKGQPIDILISNAGLVMAAVGRHNPDVGHIDYEIWRNAMEVNTFGHMRVVETFLENVSSSSEKLIILISSRMGSISFNKTGKNYAYRSSKAALNMVGKSLSIDLLPKEIGVIVIHPGNVNTHSSPRSKLSTYDSVASMRKVIDRCSLEDTGTFYKYDGTTIPW